MNKKLLIAIIVAVVVILVAIPIGIIFNIHNSEYDCSFEYVKVDDWIVEVVGKHTYYDASAKTIEVELNQDMINSLIKDLLADMDLGLPSNMYLKDVMFSTKEQRIYINTKYGFLNIPLSAKINIGLQADGISVTVDDLRLGNRKAPGFIKRQIPGDVLNFAFKYDSLGVPQVFSIKEVKFGSVFAKAVIELKEDKIIELAMEYKDDFMRQMDEFKAEQPETASIFIDKLLGTGVLSEEKIGEYVSKILSNGELVNSAIHFAIADDLEKYTKGLNDGQAKIMEWIKPLEVLKYHGSIDETVNIVLNDEALQEFATWFLPQEKVDEYVNKGKDYYGKYTEAKDIVDGVVAKVNSGDWDGAVQVVLDNDQIPDLIEIVIPREEVEKYLAMGKEYFRKYTDSKQALIDIVDNIYKGRYEDAVEIVLNDENIQTFATILTPRAKEYFASAKEYYDDFIIVRTVVEDIIAGVENGDVDGIVKSLLDSDELRILASKYHPYADEYFELGEEYFKDYTYAKSVVNDVFTKIFEGDIEGAVETVLYDNNLKAIALKFSSQANEYFAMGESYYQDYIYTMSLVDNVTSKFNAGDIEGAINTILTDKELMAIATKFDSQADIYFAAGGEYFGDYIYAKSVVEAVSAKVRAGDIEGAIEAVLNDNDLKALATKFNSQAEDYFVMGEEYYKDYLYAKSVVEDITVKVTKGDVEGAVEALLDDAKLVAIASKVTPEAEDYFEQGKILYSDYSDVKAVVQDIATKFSQGDYESAIETVLADKELKSAFETFNLDIDEYLLQVEEYYKDYSYVLSLFEDISAKINNLDIEGAAKTLLQDAGLKRILTKFNPQADEFFIVGEEYYNTFNEARKVFEGVAQKAGSGDFEGLFEEIINNNELRSMLVGFDPRAEDYLSLIEEYYNDYNDIKNIMDKLTKSAEANDYETLIETILKDNELKVIITKFNPDAEQFFKQGEEYYNTYKEIASIYEDLAENVASGDLESVIETILDNEKLRALTSNISTDIEQFLNTGQEIYVKYAEAKDALEIIASGFNEQNYEKALEELLFNTKVKDFLTLFIPEQTVNSYLDNLSNIYDIYKNTYPEYVDRFEAFVEDIDIESINAGADMLLELARFIEDTRQYYVELIEMVDTDILQVMALDLEKDDGVIGDYINSLDPEALNELKSYINGLDKTKANLLANVSTADLSYVEDFAASIDAWRNFLVEIINMLKDKDYDELLDMVLYNKYENEELEKFVRESLHIKVDTSDLEEFFKGFTEINEVISEIITLTQEGKQEEAYELFNKSFVTD